MQKKYGFAPLGGATGPVKTAIFSGNNMRLYGIQKRTDLGDRFAAHEGGLPEERRRAQQPALRLRPQAGGMDGLTRPERRRGLAAIISTWRQKMIASIRRASGGKCHAQDVGLTP